MTLLELIQDYGKLDINRGLCVEVLLNSGGTDFWRDIGRLGPNVLDREVLELKKQAYNEHEDVAVVSIANRVHASTAPTTGAQWMTINPPDES